MTFRLNKEEERQLMEGLYCEDEGAKAEFCNIFLPIFRRWLTRWGMPAFYGMPEVSVEDKVGPEQIGQGESEGKEHSGKRIKVTQRELDDREVIANDTFVQIFTAIKENKLAIREGCLTAYLRKTLWGNYSEYLSGQWHNPTLQKLYDKAKHIRNKQQAVETRIRELETPYRHEQPADPSLSIYQWEEISDGVRIYTNLDVQQIPEPIRQERSRLYGQLWELYEEEEMAIDATVDYEYQIREKMNNPGTLTNIPSRMPDAERELMKSEIDMLFKQLLAGFPEDERPIIVGYYLREGNQPGYKHLARQYSIKEKEVRRIIGEFLKQVGNKLMKSGGDDS